ncbi:S-layer homology domain-containing protein [Bacillus shivajii]|uniref:C40 family peptidase n=1 Tax=Bacillus shivajii TaxID=1983719 RepID=UPI001CF931E5|nr:S-layer homology domain-containing protein [Bacillus shivajii]UCZ51448.1 S-layer homology domain-containing protein [Bacillus shivajii]
MAKRNITIISFSFILLFTSLFLSSQQAEANSLRQDIVNISKNYIGVPYLWGGTSTAGFDCSGFVKYVYREAGITLSRTTSTQINEGRAVNRNELKPGDIVFFNTTGVSPSHNGIYIGNNQFIHSGSSRGVEITSLGNLYWSPRYIGARRIIEDAPLPPEPLPAGQFHDVSNSYWAKHEITNISKNGYIVGFKNSFYRPEEHINRASVAAVISRVKSLNDSNNNNFSDVPSDHWAVNVISAVNDAGYFGGFNDGTFRPEQPMTRAEVSAVFERVFEWSSEYQEQDFTDITSNHWAYDQVQQMASNGITVGYVDGTFRPDDPITRAEFTVFLYRALN